MQRDSRWAATFLVLLVWALPAQAQARARSRNGAVQITSTVAGAAVRIDGKEAGFTPLRGSIPVRAGTHLVEVQKHGVGTMSQKVTVAAGATATVQVRLERDEPLPLVALEPLPATPLEPQLVFLPAPPPQAPIAAPGSMHPPVMVSLTPAAMGQETPLETQVTVDAAPAWYEHWWVWAAAGVVVAGASVLTYELVHARSQPDVTLQLNPEQRAGFHF